MIVTIEIFKAIWDIFLKHTTDFLNIDNLKTIAIFIAGIKSLWDLYKEFVLKPKLKLDIEMSNITQKNELSFDFQVNLNIFAIGGDIYLNKVYILNKKGIPRLRLYRPANTIGSSQDDLVEHYFIEATSGQCIEVTFRQELEIGWATEYQREDFTQLELDDKNFSAAIESIGGSSFFALRDFKLAKGSRKSLTLLGRMYSPQAFDNSKDGRPPTGWYLCIDYGVGKIKNKIFVTKA